MLSLPFALVGGVWYIFALRYNLSVAVGVGFIALFGLAAETGVIMLVYLNMVYKRMLREGKIQSIEDIHKAVIEGAVLRVRAVSMTVGTTMVGLMPVMFIKGAGSQVMRRIAAPMIGGLVTSTILTLVIIPVIFAIWKSKALKAKENVSTEKRDEKDT